MRRLITILFLLIHLVSFGQYEKLFSDKNINPYNLILKDKFIWLNKEVKRDSLVYAELKTDSIRFRYFDESYTHWFYVPGLSGIRDTLQLHRDSLRIAYERLIEVEGLDTTGIYHWNRSLLDAITASDTTRWGTVLDLSDYTTRTELTDTSAAIRATIPTSLTELDSTGFTITESQISDLEHFSGEYDSLLNRPVLMDNAHEGDPLFKNWNRTDGINIYSKQIFDWDGKLEPYALETDITGGVLDVDFTSLAINGTDLGVILHDTANVVRSEIPTLLTELDSTGFRITESQISDLQNYQFDSDTLVWDATKYDIDTLGFLRSYTETDPIFNSHLSSSITEVDTTRWGTTYFYKDVNGIRYDSNIGLGAASSSSYRLYANGSIRATTTVSGTNLSASGFFLSSGEIIFDPKPNQTESMFSYNGSVWMDSDDNKLYFTNSDGTYDLTAGGISTTYNGWTLYTDNTNRGTILNNEIVNFVAGTNMTLSYNSTNNTITFNSSSTGGESLWASDSYGINYAVSGKHVGIGSSSVAGYSLNVDQSLAGWSGRFRNSNTSGHGLEIITGNTSGSYYALQLANSSGAIMNVANAGNVRLHKYGQGNYGGTVANYLAVDSNGNVIEALGTSGGTGTPGGASGNIQYNNEGTFGGFGSYNSSRVLIDNRLTVRNSLSSYPYLNLINGENLGYLGWHTSDATTITAGFKFDPTNGFIEVVNTDFKPEMILDENNSTGAIGETLIRTSTGIDWMADGSVGAPTDAAYLVTTSNANLTNEIVVGTAPSGDLGGTWSAISVDDDSHSHTGSTISGLSVSDLTSVTGTPSSSTYLRGDNTWGTIGPNVTVLSLSGTAPSWNMSNGINAKITLSGNTTITLSNVPTGYSGNLVVTNAATAYTIQFSGYTVKISPFLDSASGVITMSGESEVDMLSWYYDGNNIIINGTFRYD
jgi:hypothetical protein